MIRSENIILSENMILSGNMIWSENFRFSPKMRFSFQFEIFVSTISCRRFLGDKTPFLVKLFLKRTFENWFLKVQDSNLRLLFKWYRLIVSSSTILNWVRLWDALNENDPWIRVDYLVSNPRIYSHSPFQVQ